MLGKDRRGKRSCRVHQRLGCSDCRRGSDARVGLLSIMLGDDPQNGLSHITAIDELSDLRPLTSMLRTGVKRPGVGEQKAPSISLGASSGGTASSQSPTA